MRTTALKLNRWPTLWLMRIMVLLFVGGCAKSVVAESAPRFEGEFIQGGLLIGRLPETMMGAKVTVMGRPVLTNSDGVFVFGLGRDEKGPAEITLALNEQTHTFQYSVQQRTYNIQQIEGVAQKHVTPPDEVLDRIRREGIKVREARALEDPRGDFLQSFIWPLSGPITGVYGSQRVYNGIPKSPHYGVDIAAPTGTAVVAPADGLITLAEPDLYYSGGTVILDHGHGISSTFIHLHKVLVAVGASVKQGQVIAEVGATGRATGPHLDWRMNWFEHRLDPAILMANVPMQDANNSAVPTKASNTATE